MKLAALGRLKKIPQTYNGEKDIITFSQLFYIGSFSYLQVTMTHKRAWMSSKFDQTRPQTTELAALERRKKDFATFSRLLLIQSILNL